MTPSIDRTLHQFWPLLIWTLLPNLTFYLIVQGFHRTYATGAACQQRTLTPPDTWSCPTLGLACVLMSRPISPELVLSPDFWISNIPRYFSFVFFGSNICIPNDSSIFLIFSRCNRETLICRTDLCPGIHFLLKVILSWMDKMSFMCKCYHRISIKTGLRRLNRVVSYIKHQQTRNAAQFWASEVFELSYLSSIFFCNKTGVLQ